MNSKKTKLLAKAKRYIVNRDAVWEATFFFFLTIFWFLFGLLYIVAVAYKEGILIRSGIDFSYNEMIKINAFFIQTKILASFVIVSIALYGYQMYQRIGIKNIIKRERIDVIN